MADATAAYKKPLPKRRGFAGQFYEFCKKHELRFQRCTDCKTWRHVPRNMCAKCGSFNWAWDKSSGKGKIYSWTTAEQTMLPQFTDVTPYSPANVELEQWVRMVTWITDIPNEELKLDTPVEVVFDDVTPEVTLPKFRRAR
jgi:uncharacterized OB-fold protein